MWRTRWCQRLTSNGGDGRLADSVAGKSKMDRDLPIGGEVVTPAGRHWWIEKRLVDVWPGSSALAQRSSLAGGRPSTDATMHGELQLLASQFPQDVVFLDLETCGFAGAAIFLAGLVHQQRGELMLTQLLARTYAEEHPMLHSLWELVTAKSLLATFNGKSFDWPTVIDRTAVHRLVPGDQQLMRPAHCDLLHHARRRWKRVLPNCRLQTLEGHICGRHRAGDISGNQIGPAYHRYVRSGETSELRRILHHNALDLVTLVQLACVLTLPPAASNYVGHNGSGAGANSRPAC